MQQGRGAKVSLVRVVLQLPLPSNHSRALGLQLVLDMNGNDGDDAVRFFHSDAFVSNRLSARRDQQGPVQI